MFEQRVPVGVVSNTYSLAQHHEVAEQCFEGIREAGVKASDLRCEVGLTELGEWRIREMIRDSMEEVRNDEARMTRWTQTAVTPADLAPWVNKDVSTAWGKKAACRVFHICNGGHDVEIDDPFAAGEACEKPVHPTRRVPGSAEMAANLFDVAQAMSWVATGRNNPDERLEWQSSVPRLVSQLGRMVVRDRTPARGVS